MRYYLEISACNFKKTQTFSKLHHSHTKILHAATNPACGVEILETSVKETAIKI
jgi:hypothetical protein